MIQNLTEPQKLRLTDLLLDCPAMQDRGSREALLQHLPRRIANAIKAHDAAQTHILNIVTACGNYPGGLDALLEMLRFFDKETHQFNAVIGFLEGNGAVPPGTDTAPLEQKQNAGVNISAGRDLSVNGDSVGGDKITNVYQTTPAGKPLHRPPKTAHFTGRKPELDKLLNDLRPGKTITLCGPGGIGKTALAIEALWKLAPANEPPERFPDGIVFHSFYNQSSADLALEGIAKAFGGEPKPTPEMGARQALSGKTALLFLDGTEDADDLSKVQGVAGSCGVIVTSRNVRDAQDDWQDIRPLKPDDALKLLQEWAERQIDNHDSAKRICELTGYLPLAVRLAGRYLKHTKETATEYFSWLEDTPLEALDPDETRHRDKSVPYLLERSLEQVGKDARAVLALAGQLAMVGFAQIIVTEALQLSAGAMHRAFRELTGYGLLLRSGERYEVSHALIHTYARERLNVDAEVMERLIDWYTALVKVESVMGLDGYHRLDGERTHLLKLLDRCMKREEWWAAKNLAVAIEDYLDVQGYWSERITVNKAGVETSRKLDNQRDEGRWLGNLGIAYQDIGQIKMAIEHYEQALEISRKTGDRQGEGDQMGNLGNTYYFLGQVGKAIEYYNLALVIAQKIGDRRKEGTWLGNLALAYSNLGQVEKAIKHHNLALVIARKTGDKRGEGNQMANLGFAYSVLGQVEKSVKHYDWALVIFREIGDRSGEGHVLGNLGFTYGKLGQVDKAIEYYEQALKIHRKVGDRRQEGNQMDSLGSIYSNLGQFEKAIEYYEQALKIHRKVGDRRGEGVHLHNLGNLYKNLSQTNKASQYLQNSLDIFEEIKSPNAEESRKLLEELEVD